MKHFTLRELVAATGGTYFGDRPRSMEGLRLSPATAAK